MRKQDISPARTIADAERRATARDSAIEKKIEVKYLRRDGNQVVALINSSTDLLHIKGNRISIESDNFELTKEGEIIAKKGKIGGWVIEGDYIHNAKGEYGDFTIEWANPSNPLIHGTIEFGEGYLFYFMSAEGFMYRVCKEDDFNCETKTDDFSILTISNVTKKKPQSGGGDIFET